MSPAKTSGARERVHAAASMHGLAALVAAMLCLPVSAADPGLRLSSPPSAQTGAPAAVAKSPPSSPRRSPSSACSRSI